MSCNNSTRVKVIGGPEDRKKSMMIAVITMSNEVKELILTKDLACKLVVGAFRTVTNLKFTSGPVCYGTKNSKIFKTKDFEVDSDVVSGYLHAPKVSVADALRSPKRRRVSVKGKVTKVYGVTSGVSGDDVEWKRRDVLISDEETSSSIRLKLWNENYGVLGEKDEGREVVIENVIVSVFKGISSLDSTGMIHVEVWPIVLDSLCGYEDLYLNS
ncbi:uncharacterized protein LOC141910021 [Tubulanus polymorphus]|uniref:uncharacterized protein LOC141910021 n=1 Tax=Tubulanus polymorphus TaxID=672921 RepID=UPI003DA31A34